LKLAAASLSCEASGLRAQASKTRTLFLVAAVILLNAAGNLSLAWGMRHISQALSWNPLGYVAAMLNPYVALGMALLIMWLLTRMALLSWADLSFVLPMTGLGYILVAVLGVVFLDETVSAARWTGIVLIFAGTTLVGTTSQKTSGSRSCE
jgi:uncharacterized membrane protein